jgi:hypothetical protein
MRGLRSLTGGAITLLLAMTVLAPTGAKAVTVEVAKKCSALMAKEFPPREPGNPAAGSAKGNGQAAREYYKKCVDNGGNVDGTADKNAK